MANISRPANQKRQNCIQPTPTPSMRPVFYNPPGCYLTVAEKESIIDRFLKLADPNAEIFKPDVDGDLFQAVTLSLEEIEQFEQCNLKNDPRLKVGFTDILKDLKDSLNFYNALAYGAAAAVSDLICNPDSKIKAKILEENNLDPESGINTILALGGINQTVNLNFPFTDNTGKVYKSPQDLCENFNEVKNDLRKNAPKFVTDLIDSYIETGVITKTQFLKLQVSRSAKQFIQRLTGQELGFLITKRELEELQGEFTIF